MLAAFTCLALLCPPQAGEDPARLDRSGVQWSFGFPSAVEAAARDSRLLLLVPSAWAATDNGDFGQKLEPFRAGPLCDERVRGLLNRRFVCVHFNIFEDRAAHDAAACAFLQKVVPEFGQPAELRPGVPVYSFGSKVFVMTVDGALIAEIDSHSPTDEVLNTLQKALQKNPKFNRPTAAEKGLKDDLERARLLYDIGDDKGAQRYARKVKGEEARLLEARIARRQRDWKAHQKLLNGIEAEAHWETVQMERAYARWHAGELEALITAVDAIEPHSRRRAEAQYWKGMALFLQQKPDAALAVWQELIEAHRDQPDPWLYRADWAYCNLKQPTPVPAGLDVFERAPSLLGRSSYCGRRNPDLDGPPRR